MNECQWISFEVASEHYLHAVENIKEIIPYKEPTPVPGSQDITLGIQNIRGQIVSINSCRKILHTDLAHQGNEERIIIIENNEQLIGVAVDTVGEIISADPQDVDNNSSEIRSHYITGTLNKAGKLYIVSDFSPLAEKSFEE